MSLVKSLSDPIEYSPLPILLSNNPDNANRVSHGAMAFQRLGY